MAPRPPLSRLGIEQAEAAQRWAKGSGDTAGELMRNLW
jgi:hypothetical protein